MANGTDRAQKELKFKQMYKQYYAPFCLYAKRYVKDLSICEDLVSDIFTNLWNRIGDLDLDSPSTVSFLKICVRNTCLNYLKRNIYEEDYKEQAQFSKPAYEEDSPDRIYTLEELYRMLHEILEKLPESHRAVFIKTFVEGKKQEEIARELDISTKSVTRYKQKTLDILRNELKDYLPLLLLLIRLG